MTSTKKHSLITSVLTALCLCAALNASADAGDSAPVTLTVELDRLSAEVGDVFTLNVDVAYDTTYGIFLPDNEKAIGEFEVQEGAWENPVVEKDGFAHVEGRFRLWALKTGEQTIPAITIQFAPPRAADDTSVVMLELSSAPVTVSVESLIADSDSALAPMTEPLEDPLALSDLYQEPVNWPLVIGVGVLLLAALGGALYYWKRKRSAEQIDTREPWEIAFERLAGLANSSYLAEGRFKEYYSDLTSALKEFIGKALVVNAPDMTTGETLAVVSSEELTAEHADKIREVLTQADMVKFARMTPPPERPREDFNRVHEVIDSVKTEVLERRRIEAETYKQEAAKSSASEIASKTEREASHV